jgi:phosphate transport system permease protein
MSEAAETSFRNPAALKRLRRRRAADARFRIYGIVAIGVALLALFMLLWSIAAKSFGAFTQHVVTCDIVLDAAAIAPPGQDTPAQIARNVDGFYGLLRDNLIQTFPEAGATRGARQEIGELVTRLAVLPVAEFTANNPASIGTRVRANVPISDELDMYLKGAVSPELGAVTGVIETLTPSPDGRFLARGKGAFASILGARAAMDADRGANADRTVLITAGQSTARLFTADADTATLSLLTGTADAFRGQRASARLIARAEAERTVSDQQIAWALALKADGRIKSVAHTGLLTAADSTYPELAGALAAIVGSLFTVLITAFIAIPVGVFASVYLEEFAPKNRITDLIEVNINNLAAVPSIVFGLLGAAVFLGFFGMPRSAPLVGGLVLALMTLPVVIIAARAALKAVPPSIRAGALAVGASKMQSVFHHVVPLAAPGIFTGSILGLARALGETAPLLLIGMVAFVNQVPRSPMDESTALPVLIYSWANRAERAWEPMTAAIIIALLVMLVLMNAVVVILRRRFERRW